MMKKEEYKIKLAEEYLNDDLYQFEVEKKGCLLGVIVECKELCYRIDFYNTTRFKQDVDNELISCNYIYEFNVVFLKSITLKHVLKAIKEMWEKRCFDTMIPISRG